MTQSAQDSRRSDVRDSCLVLAAGLAIVGFLTYYNTSGMSVWISGPFANYRSWDEYLIVNVCFLLFVPSLITLVALRLPAEEVGFIAPIKGGARIAALLFLAMAPVLVVASRFPIFYQHYPMHEVDSWKSLIFHETTYGFYLFCWEFFYRGFLTFGLARGFGAVTAVVLQAIAFGIMHIGKPVPEVIGSFPAGIALGWLALRSGSFLPCFAVHWAVSVSFDILCIQARPGGLF